MASVIYEIDPDVDTVIILRSPEDGEYFACWDDSPFDNPDILDQLPFSMPEWDTQMTISDDVEVHQSPAETFAIKRSAFRFPSVPEGYILYYVSSRYLTLASPIFRAALSSGRWCEGCKKVDGRYHITADDWEEEAFLLFMSMLHLRSREFPRSVSLELLAKLGILVDYHDCARAMEFFTTVWLNKLHSFEIQSSYCRDSDSSLRR